MVKDVLFKDLSFEDYLFIPANYKENEGNILQSETFSGGLDYWGTLGKYWKKQYGDVEFSNIHLKENADNTKRYTVTFNPNTGSFKTTQKVTADITLQAKWKKVTVKAGKLSKVKNVKGKKISLKIKKLTGVKGYEISYVTNKKFKSAKKKTTSKTTITLTKLIKGKTYHVRAYKMDSKGKKVYGKWSKVEKVKIQK